MTIAEPTQLQRRFTDEKQLRFPSVCIENTSLCDLVLAVVRQFDTRQLVPVAAAAAGIACQSRVLLGLLTYCYASGIFSSRDIEARVRLDPILILLCGRELPDWHRIRHFRRYNHEAIHAASRRLFAMPTPFVAHALPRDPRTTTRSCRRPEVVMSVTPNSAAKMPGSGFAGPSTSITCIWMNEGGSQRGNSSINGSINGCDWFRVKAFQRPWPQAVAPAFR